jgi:hypothetical protein
MAQERGPQGQGERKESERRVFVGIVGREPKFREVNDGRNPGQMMLVGDFSVAEHPNPDDRGETVWHEVSVFRGYAGAAKDLADAGELRKGALVHVVGYGYEQPVVRDSQPVIENGVPLMREKINAVQVKIVPPRQPGESPARR